MTQPFDAADYNKRLGEGNWRSFNVKSLQDTFVVSRISGAKYRELTRLSLSGASMLEDYESIAMEACVSHRLADGTPDKEYLSNAFDVSPHLPLAMATAALQCTTGDVVEEDIKKGATP